MSFIDQHQIVAFKKTYRYSLVAIRIAQFGNLKHIDILIGKQAACTVLVEYIGADITFPELFKMLVCQPFVRGDKDDAIWLPAIFFCIVEILQYIDVHQQRLPRTCCRPESHFVQVGFRKVGHAMIGFRVGIKFKLKIGVDVGKQFILIAEISVKIYLREKQA